MPRADQAESLAQLLNLAYASGRVAGKEEALGIIEQDEKADAEQTMDEAERSKSDAADDKCDRMRGN